MQFFHAFWHGGPAHGANVARSKRIAVIFVDITGFLMAAVSPSVHPPF